MSGFHHTYEDENDARARETATEMAQTLKELGDYQNCILIALGVMIRSGASKASLAQVENATAEYGKRFGASWTTRPITDCRRRHRTGTRLKLNIKLAVEIDDNATIADMR